MSSSLPLELASTIQSASLNRAPSPTHDLNPSTAASAKLPVRLSPPEAASHSPPSRHPSSPSQRPSSPSPSPRSPSPSRRPSSTPYATIRPLPRRAALPPLPDLRFEQSYLASLAGVEGWRGVAYITIRDQILLPLVQGALWTLALSGWRQWNRTATYSGRGVGARARRWWWGVNNWEVPGEGAVEGGGEKMAREVGEFVQGQMGAGGD
ncbi:hypothetical protein MMC13_005572 [Lambiella insularis]|nr:hypothetical protein [Lambiella insularis]